MKEKLPNGSFYIIKLSIRILLAARLSDERSKREKKVFLNKR